MSDDFAAGVLARLNHIAEQFERLSVGQERLRGDLMNRLVCMQDQPDSDPRRHRREHGTGRPSANDLVVKAMLNPGLANVLLARVTDKSRPNVAKALGVALSRAAAANAAAGLVAAENWGR